MRDMINGSSLPGWGDALSRASLSGMVFRPDYRRGPRGGEPQTRSFAGDADATDSVGPSVAMVGSVDVLPKTLLESTLAR
jgi:hypothetical protein